MSRANFSHLHPNAFYLDAGDVSSLESLLRNHMWIGSEERIDRVEKAGEGNMNYVLRVRTQSGRSLIVKQARPWVEKYPQIAAPWDRARVEGRFYEAIRDASTVSSSMPKLIGVDTDSRIIALEDLGEARDLTGLYDDAALDQEDILFLTGYLRDLHNIPVKDGATFANQEMRSLNHEHIFRLPLHEKDISRLESFTPGLGEVASELRANNEYVEAVSDLGLRYLHSDGPSLLHGDFYPGSWVRGKNGLRVIDPEFCFMGPPEFDIGVMVAHLLLAEEPDDLVSEIFSHYEQGRKALDRSLSLQFAGVEIMRRLLGVAQLPLKAAIDRKRDLLDLSRQMVLNPVKESSI